MNFLYFKITVTFFLFFQQEDVKTWHLIKCELNAVMALTNIPLKLHRLTGTQVGIFLKKQKTNTAHDKY